VNFAAVAFLFAWIVFLLVFFQIISPLYDNLFTFLDSCTSCAWVPLIKLVLGITPFVFTMGLLWWAIKPEEPPVQAGGFFQ